MIKVNKSTCPLGLLALKNSCAHLNPEQAYDELSRNNNTALKHTVKESLIKEQGHLCVYCMCKISKIEDASIEHFIPLKRTISPYDVGQGLDYNNLFAVCRPDINISKRYGPNRLTCDKSKGNTELLVINPLDENTLKSIEYDYTGRIFSKNPNVNKDLNDTLNLNSSNNPLITERKAVLDELINELALYVDNPSELKNHCKYLLNEYESETDPKTPYVGILIWYLKTM